MNTSRTTTIGVAICLALAAGALGACGSAVKHAIHTEYDAPQSQAEANAKEILKLGGTDGVAKGFTKSIKLRKDLTIHARSGNEGPYYDPSTKTVNLSYGFVDTTAAILKKGQPGITDEEFGKQWAAVDAFILIHELAHSFVDTLEIPITGREEDAVDGLATVFLTDAVANGAEYAFDAARFFNLLQDAQGAPNVRQYQDEHSLSVQRSFDIVCAVAGSSQETMAQIERLDILPPERLQRCPAEYAQKSRSWKILLKPHLRKEA
jgi:hypothetical protein